MKAWAKKKDDEWHSLLAHSAEVAATLRLLLTEAGLRAQLRELGQTDIWPLVELAFYHDAGKANAGFQRRDGTGHLRPIIALLHTPHGEKYLSALPIGQMASWLEGEGKLISMLEATWAHHGEPIADTVSHDPEVWKDAGQYSPTAELGRLADFADANFKCGGEISYSPELENFFAGALTLADWIASDRRHFGWENGRDHGLWERSTGRAREALGQIGLLAGRPHSSLRRLLGEDNPYEVQVQGTELEGDLVFAESPTGSGKTELALGRYLEMRKAGGARGLYFAVPTRAAAKQLHGRVHEAVQDTFEDPPPVVQAVPGYAKFDDERAIGRDEWTVQWERDDLRGWAAETSKRYTASPIAVGTIDQALLSMLESSHAHMRMVGLSGGMLAVDEIHSLSRYMKDVLRRLLDVHFEAGGKALLMSATVGAETRSLFLEEETPGLEEAKKTGYPYVASRAREDGKEPGFPDKLRKTVDLDVRVAEDPDAAFKSAVESQTGRVLGIRNTVGGARSVQKSIEADTLEARGKEVAHHSRYAQPDRQLLDQAVEDAYDKDSDVDQITTIATQTVEQSLDIDSDVLVTDHAPTPVILQRIGRLWRHPIRTRPPGIEKARCIIIAPKASFPRWLTSEGEAYGPMGFGTVYSDLRVLKASLQALRSEDCLQVPEGCRELVEKSVHPDKLGRVTPPEEQWEKRKGMVLGEKRKQKSRSERAALDWSVPYSEMAFSNEEVRSRLGELPFTVELEATTPFANEISELSLPAWMLEDEEGNRLNPTPGDAEVTEQAGDHFRFRVLDKRYVYDKHGFREDRS